MLRVKQTYGTVYSNEQIQIMQFGISYMRAILKAVKL